MLIPAYGQLLDNLSYIKYVGKCCIQVIEMIN